jgi:glucose/arabinose dehydrogenase
MARTRASMAAVTLAAVGLLAACGSAEPTPTPSAVLVTPQPEATRAAPPSPEPPPMAQPPALPAATAAPQDVVVGLAAPWGLAFLPSGAVLVTLRDRAVVLLLDASGVRELTGPGASELAGGTVTGGEGGLLGVAVSPDFAFDHLVFLYRTAADGNQVVRAELDSVAGSLGPLTPLLTGIPAAGNHNGGRLAFGPDGMLYVTTGDAAQRPASQDPTSLAGKILRLTPDGAPAPGNPTAGSPVWSLGHRNVQGLGWDSSGRMFASEFGQNTWDELNLITPGTNYGWPEVEGTGGVAGFADPLVTWATDDASPSGIAVTDDAVYLAALRGRRLWVVPLTPDGVGEPRAVLVGELGRLRAAAIGPDGALWLLTNNTDGRGDPRDGDDRLVRMLPP